MTSSATSEDFSGSSPSLLETRDLVGTQGSTVGGAGALLGGEGHAMMVDSLMMDGRSVTVFAASMAA